MSNSGWFLVSGCIGIVISLALTGIGSYHVLNPRLLMTLWPTSIVGIGDPATVSENMLTGAVEFGGNFLLYGVLVQE